METGGILPGPALPQHNAAAFAGGDRNRWWYNEPQDLVQDHPERVCEDACWVRVTPAAGGHLGG